MNPGREPERRIPGITPTLRKRLRLLFRLLSYLSPQLAARLALRLFTTPRRRRVAPAERVFLATARQRTLHTSSGAIRCYEWSAAGPTVLVVHGWISHAARLEPTILGLHARGLRVIAIDAPAHGNSAGTRSDVRAFQAALAAVDQAYGPIDGVLAHSFGALNAAAWLAGIAPDSLQLRAAGDSALPAVRAAVLVGLPRDVAYLLESFTLMLALQPRVVAKLRALMRLRYGSDPEDFSAARLAPRIRIPVLLVHGEVDEFIPVEHATDVAEQLVDGQVRVIAGSLHSAPLRDPATVALMADFLARYLDTPPAPSAN